MSKKLSIPLMLLGIVILGFIAWKSNTYQHSTDNNPSQKKSTKPLPKETVINLDKKGFSPAVVTIKVGSAVRWKNVSGDNQTVNSDDYPNNQLHKELNFGIFNNGSTVVYTFTKPGTYGYHNQLHHEQTGKITVTQ
jgi:plastocyanin